MLVADYPGAQMSRTTAMRVKKARRNERNIVEEEKINATVYFAFCREYSELQNENSRAPLTLG